MPTIDGIFAKSELVSNPVQFLVQEIREDPSLIYSIALLVDQEEDEQVNVHDLYHQIPNDHWEVLCQTVLPEVTYQTIFPYGISYSGGTTPFRADQAQDALDSVEISRWRVWLSLAKWKFDLINLSLVSAFITSIALIVESFTDLAPSTIDFGPFATFINSYLSPAISTLANPNILIGIFGIVVTLTLHKRQDQISGEDLNEVHNQLQNDLQELREIIENLQQEIED